MSKELAATYCALMNRSVKAYRKVLKREGLKLPGNPACAGATYASYEMT